MKRELGRAFEQEENASLKMKPLWEGLSKDLKTGLTLTIVTESMGIKEWNFCLSGYIYIFGYKKIVYILTCWYQMAVTKPIS